MKILFRLLISAAAASLLALASGCGDSTSVTVKETRSRTQAAPAAGISPATGAPGDSAVQDAWPPNVRGWRGNGTGVFRGVTPPTEWDDKKNVKWKAKVGGSNSTPVVCGSRVFVTSEKSTLHCLNRTDGKEIWKRTIDADSAPPEFKEKLSANSDFPAAAGLATPTPVCDGEAVYAVFGTGAICCFENDGSRRWFAFINPVGLQYGQSASPLLADGKLIVCLDGLAALDAKTGKVLWENKEVEKAYGTPALMMLGQTRVVITPMGAVVRLSDGKLLAKDIAAGLGGDEFAISPVVHGDSVYFVDRTASAVKLELQGEGGQMTVHAAPLWPPVNLPDSAIGSPCIHDGLIYACSRTAHYTVLDAQTGKRCLVNSKDGKMAEDWVVNLGAAGGPAQDMDNATVYPSVGIAGKYVYLSNDQGQTLVLETGKVYKEVSRNPLPEGAGSSLFFDGPDLFVYSGDMLYRIGPK